jgi:glycosyltransferase involved in cell wall biosynthesis
MGSPELGIYTRYDTRGASSRYRYFMYEDALRSGGFEPRFHYFYDNEYLRELYSGRKDYPALLRAWRRRRGDAAAIPAYSLIEYELFPFLNWRVDWHYLRKSRYVVNFDDNVWEKYARIPWLKHKFDRVAEHAAGVIAANDFLLEKVAKLNPRTIKIPTVPDVESYRCDKPKYDCFTVVWIGTPVTYVFLEEFTDTLRAMTRAVPGFELLAVASSTLKPLDGVRMRCLDWSQEAETEILCRSHAGIMPLSDTGFTRGKSAFKIIQYMAAGLPIIASPVGENNLVVKPETGFLPRTPDEWCDALRQLACDPELYRRMSAASKQESAGYSLRRWAPILTEFLHNAYRNE